MRDDACENSVAGCDFANSVDCHGCFFEMCELANQIERFRNVTTKDVRWNKLDAIEIVGLLISLCIACLQHASTCI